MIDGSTVSAGASAITTARAKYFLVSIVDGWKGYVPSALGAKSRIQSLVAPT